MGSKLNRATGELCLDAAFVTSGAFKGFADFKLAKSDGTLFAVKTRSLDGFRALLKRASNDKNWISVETTGIKNSVNEYGGTGLHAISGNNFAYTSGQTIFWNRNGSVTEFSHPDCHFADLNFVDKFLFCVVENHAENGSSQFIGRFEAEKNDSFETISKGYDFYASPRISPNGQYLLYLGWNDPNMPWDATSVHLLDLSASPISDLKLLPLSDKAITNYNSIQWNSNGQSFYYISDENDYWSIYEYHLTSKQSNLIAAVEGKDLGDAIWNIGDDRFYAVNSKWVIYRDGINLYAKSLSNQKVRLIGSSDFTSYSRIYIDESNTVFCIASGPLETETVLAIQLDEDGNSEIRVIDQIMDTAEFKEAKIEPVKSIKYNVNQDIQIEGFYYAPINKKFGEKPPLIVMAHAGPTGQTSTTFDKKKLFYRSHGFAIFDINYRGSTGYGRKFRDLLYYNWGEVDVIDVCEGAKYLISMDLVDKDNVFITGSSAGGYLVLRALFKEPKLFKAAVCSYGFSDLFALTAETHRFELAYNYHLIASKEQKDVWNERNMADKLDKIITPMLLYHGTEDRVVPFQQSEQIHKFLLNKGIRTELEIFEGEGHGFRRSENTEKVLNGTLKFFREAMNIDKAIPISHI